jgi:hypothetical protein
VFFILNAKVPLLLLSLASDSLDIVKDDTIGLASVLLPQVLHILTTTVRQRVNAEHEEFRLRCVQYTILSGVVRKLRTVFSQLSALKAPLDTGTPWPVLLVKAATFVQHLFAAYRPVSPSGCHDEITALICRTDLAGLVTLLASILLAEGPIRGSVPPRLSHAVVQICSAATKALLAIAALDLQTFQTSAGATLAEFHHVIAYLVEYGASRRERDGDGEDQSKAVELLHDAITLLGYFTVGNLPNARIMSMSAMSVGGATLTSRLAALPLCYFMEEKYRGILFPTFVACAVQSPTNLELLQAEMSLVPVVKYLKNHAAAGVKEQNGILQLVDINSAINVFEATEGK